MKIIFLLIAITISNVLASEQSIRITGRMMCHGQPAQYVELQLVSKKIIGGTAFARDVFTDAEGLFDISGYIDESTWTNMDARLYVWHKCFEKPYEHQDPCYNWFDIAIPNHYMNEGVLAQEKWEMKDVNLHDRRDGQTLDRCD